MPIMQFGMKQMDLSKIGSGGMPFREVEMLCCSTKVNISLDAQADD